MAVTGANLYTKTDLQRAARLALRYMGLDDDAGESIVQDAVESVVEQRQAGRFYTRDDVERIVKLTVESVATGTPTAVAFADALRAVHA